MGDEAPAARGNREAFGFVRLVLASLVVVSHSAELVDGDGRREPLERLVGTTNLGFVAVYGFFLVSGYLITASALRGGSARAFLRRRCARIYPGFAVASLVCVAVVLPLSGGVPAGRGAGWLASTAGRILLLQRPVGYGAFAGQHFHQEEVALDGAMWTIPYEFGCYLLVAVFAATGLLRRRGAIAGAAAAFLAASVLLPDGIVNRLAIPALLPASPRLGLAVLGMFATGSAFYSWRERIGPGRRQALVAAAVLVIGVPVAPLTTLALAAGGGCLVLAAARMAGRTRLSAVNERTDISYGLYLYAWPVEQLLIRYAGADDLMLLATETWGIAAAAGWCSWVLVERPAIRWAKHGGRRGSGPVPAMRWLPELDSNQRPSD